MGRGHTILNVQLVHLQFHAGPIIPNADGEGSTVVSLELGQHLPFHPWTANLLPACWDHEG